jgi:hypothetical protein
VHSVIRTDQSNHLWALVENNLLERKQTYRICNSRRLVYQTLFNQGRHPPVAQAVAPLQSIDEARAISRIAALTQLVNPPEVATS